MKAHRIDAILAELIKKAGDKMNEKIYRIAGEIYETGELPDDFTKLFIRPITKNPMMHDSVSTIRP